MKDLEIGMVRFFAAIILAAATADAAEPEPRRVDLRPIVANNARISPDPRSRRGANASDALEVTFLPAEWPNVTVKAPKPWDWSREGELLLDLKNPGSEPIEFGIRIDDDPAADGTVHC